MHNTGKANRSIVFRQNRLGSMASLMPHASSRLEKLSKLPSLGLKRALWHGMGGRIVFLLLHELLQRD